MSTSKNNDNTKNIPYIPINQILKNELSVDKPYWLFVLKSVEKLFLRNQIPNIEMYDLQADIKINRGLLFEEEKNFEKDLKKSLILSDHKIISKNNLHSWNILHHYSYNKGHDYLSFNKICNSNSGDYQVRFPIPESIRYNLIIKKIFDYLKYNRDQCFALQECEFYVYKELVKKLEHRNYSSRFIPHKIRYGKNGLQIESFGCALFVYNQFKDQNINDFQVNGYLKKREDYQELSYKFIIAKKQRDVYTSIHFPCYREDVSEKWDNYFHQDMESIFSSFDNVKRYYFLGDMNICSDKMDELLDKYSKEYDIDYANFGVDYIMTFKKNNNSIKK